MNSPRSSWRARTALTLSLAPLAGCVSWRAEEPWSFAFTRAAYESMPAEPREWSRASGGVEDLVIVGLALLPVSLTIVADACMLPFTVPHDVYVACTPRRGDEAEEPPPWVSPPASAR